MWMKQIKNRTIFLRCAATVFLCFMISMVSPLYGNASSKTAKGKWLTTISQRDPDGTSWKITYANGKIVYSYTNPTAPDGSELWFKCDACQHQEKTTISKHYASITHIVSGHPNTVRNIVGWYRKNNISSFEVLGMKKGYFSNGTVRFYSGAGQSEIDFYKSLSKLNKKILSGTPKYIDSSTLKSMKSTVNIIIRGCKSDEQKVKAIHDWICTNIQYDYSNVNNSPNTGPGNNIAYVYKYKRAVCGGYAQLMNAFLGIANIPCVYILGYAGNITSGKTYADNHAWNAVYFAGKWQLIDSCWDSSNAYYGPYDNRNVRGKNPKYTYYKTNPDVFGESHLAFKVFFPFSCGGSYLSADYGDGQSVFKIVGKKKVVLHSIYDGHINYTIWNECILGGKKYKVIGISSNAFSKSSKTKKLKVIARYLNAKHMKNSLKNSKISKVILYKRYFYPHQLKNLKTAFQKKTVGKSVKITVTQNLYQ